MKQIDYTKPFVALVFLFFIVGFLTTANAQFQAPLQEAFLSEMQGAKNSMATLVTFAWFLAYPFFGKVGARWINLHGYKYTLMGGLALMILGLSLSFASSWFTVNLPQAFLNCYGHPLHGGFLIFLLGSFVTGGSATVLQVVINPYLSACTVRGTQAVQRLAIGGSANSIGTTMAPYVVIGILFGGASVEHAQIEQLMLPFALLALMACLLMLGLSKLSLPDIEGTRTARDEIMPRTVWSYRHFKLGVVAIFCYVGVEVCVGANINMYAVEKHLAQPALLATIYWGGMLVGRLVGSAMSRITPRTQLITTTTSASLLVICAVCTDNPWMLVAVGLFHSIMWGAIFTLATAKLGRYTSMASGAFMIGVVGGAIFPLLQGIVADAIGGWQWSWSIILIGELFMLFYAISGSKVKE